MENKWGDTYETITERGFYVHDNYIHDYIAENFSEKVRSQVWHMSRFPIGRIVDVNIMEPMEDLFHDMSPRV